MIGGSEGGACRRRVHKGERACQCRDWSEQASEEGEEGEGYEVRDNRTCGLYFCVRPPLSPSALPSLSPLVPLPSPSSAHARTRGYSGSPLQHLLIVFAGHGGRGLGKGTASLARRGVEAREEREGEGEGGGGDGWKRERGIQ